MKPLKLLALVILVGLIGGTIVFYQNQSAISSINVAPPAVLPSSTTMPVDQTEIQTESTGLTVEPLPETPASSSTHPESGLFLKVLKDVGEPDLEHFGLSEADFSQLRDADVNLIEGNFDICADHDDVQFFLDSSQQFNLQVVLPAGAGEAEWGYACNGSGYNQTPVWQKEQVQAWVRRWLDHPAVFGWDTSNEAGGNFPHDESLEYFISLEQLQQVYRDIKEIDPERPILIRMNGWYFYDNDSDFLRTGNPFGPGVADIVMVNAYSNVDEYFDDFVHVVLQRSYQSIKRQAPEAAIIAAIGVWSEPPLWQQPSIAQLQNDLSATNNIYDLIGVAFFKYGAVTSTWYLPDDAPELWEEIKKPL